MSFQITEAFVRQYSDTFMHVYQQMTSELEGTVRNETQQAEFKFWDFIGKTSVQWDRARGSKTPRISTPHSRRRCSMRVATWADTTGDMDKIQAMKDPTSDYIKAGVAAMQRAKDERILEGLGAIAYTGKEGNIAINHYDIGECRVVLGDGTFATEGAIETGTTETGLTLAKIAACGKFMDNASVPQSDRYIVANTDQKWYLIGSTKVTNSDYAAVKALVNGQINTYLGFTFKWLPSDRFAVNTVDTGCYDCFAYQRDAILLTKGKDITTRVSELPDENYDVQAFAEMMIGAVRLQGPGVVKLLLKKDPAMDFAQA
jgi:hypothetical protein